MQITFKKSYIIFIVLFLAAICLWPLQLIGKTDYVSASEKKGIYGLGEITEGVSAYGTFTPTASYLSSIGFSFYTYDHTTTDGYVLFELYDKDLNPLCSEMVDCIDLNEKGFNDFSVNLDVNENETYLYKLTAYDYGQQPPSIYAGNALIGTDEFDAFYYADNKLENVVPVMRYTYRVPLQFETAAGYYLLFILIAIFALILI